MKMLGAMVMGLLMVHGGWSMAYSEKELSAMDWLEARRHVKEKRPGVPIIIQKAEKTDPKKTPKENKTDGLALKFLVMPGSTLCRDLSRSLWEDIRTTPASDSSGSHHRRRSSMSCLPLMKTPYLKDVPTTEGIVVLSVLG